MIRRWLLSPVAVAAVAGCAGQSSPPGIPADHPAHPAAAEAPAPARSHALHDPVATASEASPTAAEPSDAPTVYTCPHHPEVTSNQPGVCPKCDMKLQPKKADAANAPPAGGEGRGGGSHDGHGSHGGH